MAGSSVQKGRFIITNDPTEPKSTAAVLKREDSKMLGEEASRQSEEGKGKGKDLPRPTSPDSQPHPFHKPSESQPETLHKVSTQHFAEPHRPRPAPSKRPPPDSTVSQAVFESFASVVSEKFSEMLQLHRDIMMEIIHKEEKRDEEAMSLCRQNADLARQLISLEAENTSKRDLLPRKD